jgi:thioredoxin-related protein
MKQAYLTILLALGLVAALAQEKPKIYNPQADAHKEIALAIEKATQSGKHVFLQIGGNWCPWCIKFHRFVHDTPALDSLINANYIVCLVNYSKENKNSEVLAELGYPQRFGFPVFVILDSQGKRLHTQDSGLLESGEGYDVKKVQSFLQNWAPDALNPTSYKN